MNRFWIVVPAIFISLIFVADCYDLVVLHTNDVHAHYVEFNEFGGRCPPKLAKEEKCFGGFARQSTKIKEIRGNKPNVMFLNGGDFFQGTVWYTLYKYKAVAEFVNQLTIDAMSLGNHEFDDGLKGLIPYLEILKPIVVVCNINASQEPEFEKFVKPSTILEIGGEKIGIIGFLTPETKFLSSTGKLEFMDEVECIKREAKRLSEEGINKIFAVGHSGLTVDIAIAKNVPEVDIVVGGHTNSFLYTGEPPSVEVPQGPYPMEINRPDGSKALIVQDFAFGKYLGYLEVSFTEDGRVDHWSGNPILLDKNTEQDPEILELLKPYSQEVERRGKEEVGRTNVLLRGDRLTCRMKECNLGNYLTDAALDYFISDPTEKGWTNVAMAIWNSGGIRGSIDERINNGSVILEDILTIAPFGNTMDIVGLKGKHLREVFEASVKDYDHEAYDPPGSFLQVSGLRITYNVSNPPGNRVLDVHARCSDCRVPKFEPLEDEKVYEVVLPTYLAKGGDAFSMIAEHTLSSRNTDELDTDIITTYMKKNKPITHGLENRITVLSAEKEQEDIPSENYNTTLENLNITHISVIPRSAMQDINAPPVNPEEKIVVEAVDKITTPAIPEEKIVVEAVDKITTPAIPEEVTTQKVTTEEVTTEELTFPTLNNPIPDMVRGTRERLNKAREDIEEGFKNIREGTSKAVENVRKRIPAIPILGGGIFNKK